MSSTDFDEFLSDVTSKIKSKAAHHIIQTELMNHLQELSQTYQSRGLSKSEADKKAIKDMGNPFMIGENLNRLHRPKLDWILIVLFIIFSGVSFLPLVGGIPELPISSHFMGRQAMVLAFSVFIIIGFLLFDYRKFKDWWLASYSSGLLLLMYTIVFGDVTMGTKRWISIWGVSLEITTITLFLFLLAWAGLLTKINEINTWIKQVLLSFLFWAPVFLYMSLPHVMSSIIYFLCIVTMLSFSHIHRMHAIRLAGINLIVGVIVVATMFSTNSLSYYYLTRLFDYINPDADPTGGGFMYVVVNDILSQAGLFGNGFNNEIPHSLPGTHTNFVFPYLVHSFGWIFGILLCLTLLLFITRMSKNAFETKDFYGRLLVIGGATLFAVPVCWNILMGFGIVPIMEVPLPFISYGGNITLFYAAIFGLILNVYRRKNIVQPIMP